MIISMLVLTKDSEYYETCRVTFHTGASVWGTGSKTSSSDEIYNSLSWNGLAGKINPTPEVYTDGYHYFG